jgi:riboflavin synthase
MFTGIVEGMGQVLSIAPLGGAFRLVLDVGAISEDVKQGDSVAIDGTCLTAVVVRPPKLEFDVVSETVARTAFASLRVGDKANIERSIRADGRFHGHFVQGHVDGTGRMTAKQRDGGETRITFEVGKLADQMIEKGSVAVDGISLTIAELTETTFTVAVIPHTLSVTSLGHKNPGSLANIEVDMLGKWIRKLLVTQLRGGEAPAKPAGSVLLPSKDAIGLTFEDLRRAGLGG